MSFGSFLSGLYHEAVPSWLGDKQTYGSVNPPKKKTLQPGDPGYVAPPTSRVQSINQNQNQNQNQGQGLRAQKPQNIFEGLNNNLNFNKPNNSLPVVSTPNSQPIKPLIPGTVVKPTTPTAEQRVNQGLDAGHSWEKIAADTGVPLDQVRQYSQKTRPNYGIMKLTVAPNYKKPSVWSTIGNTVKGVVANVPEVGLAAGRAGTGLVQGALGLPHDVSAVVAGGTQQVQKHFNNPVTRQINRGFQDINTGIKTGTHYAVNDVFDPLNRGLDTAAKLYERNVPSAAGGANVYRAEQIPLNVLAAIATLGSAPAGEAGTAAENAGRLTRIKAAISNLLNKPFGGEDNIISRTAQPIVNRIRPVAEAANSPIKAVQNFINNFRGVTPPEVPALPTEKPPTPIPVRTGVDITAPPSEPINIPVTNANTPKPLIQEVAGDAKTATTNAKAAANAVNARRVEAAKKADTGLPDRTIEGVSTRVGEKPYILDQPTVAKNQSDIIDEYAKQLKSMGEGNGVDINPETGARVSNNVRTAETAGKRMTNADWRDEARRQLEAGKAEGATQQAFNDAVNPEVQSLVNKGEPTPEAPQGKPIAVKEVKGIDVNDQTNVPQNLPETPGKVRVTTATAPTNAKAEAIAAEPTPPPPSTTKAPETTATETTPAKDVATSTAERTLPAAGESDESFLKRQAQDMQDNIKRAVTSLNATKKITKQERANQAAAGQKAYEEAKAAGKSISEQEAARKTAMEGKFVRQDYVGTPVHSADEQRLRDMVDEHYKDMPYQAGNVRDAFTKLFHAGEPGWASEPGNHIIPSDIKNIRKFLNESVPGVDGEAGLGDLVGGAIKDVADETGPGKIAKAIGLQRALRFTADISATGRQALPGALSHPVEFAKAAKKSFQVMFSHDKYQKYANELRNSKEANYINDQLGAHLSVLSDPIGKEDDIYRNSEWASKIPGVKQVVGASERQYNTILTEMRRLAGQRFIDAAGGIGNLEKVASDSGDPEIFKKAIGMVTNVNTGRGLNGDLSGKYAKVLSNVLVSPRGLAARIQRFNPKYYTDLWKANPAAAKEAMRSMAIQTGVTVMALGAAAKTGHYEDGQIKVGNTRYDITGGAANMVRTAVRIVQYMSGHRQTTPFNNAPDEATNWAKNQLAPFLSSSLSAIGMHPDGKGGYIDHWGKPVTPESLTLDNIAPVNASQVNQDLQLNTPPGQTAANAGLNTLGIGVNSYQSAADKKASTQGSSNQSTNNGSAPLSTMAEFKAANSKPDSNGIAKLNDGSYAYAINGKVSSAKDLKSAQQAVAQDALQNSDQAYKIIGDKVYRKNADGTVGAPTLKIKYDHDINAATLTSQKTAGDLEGWVKTANGQIKNIQTQLQSPNVDPQDKLTLQNEEQALVNDMAKYKAYGGFTKPKGFGTTPSVTTGFGQLKAGSFAPTVQQYSTISAKSGSIPHISAVRPNIVHKITHG